MCSRYFYALMSHSQVNDCVYVPVCMCLHADVPVCVFLSVCVCACVFVFVWANQVQSYPCCTYLSKEITDSFNVQNSFPLEIEEIENVFTLDKNKKPDKGRLEFSVRLTKAGIKLTG